MENQENRRPRRPAGDPAHGTTNRPVRRRKKRNPVDIFIHTYLPLLAVLAVLILFIIFVVNSLGRSSDRREQERQESQHESN